VVWSSTPTQALAPGQERLTAPAARAKVIYYTLAFCSIVSRSSGTITLIIYFCADVVAFDCPARVLEADPVGPQFIDPLYADPTDCQYFYVCIGGKEPRRNGCTTGLVFNDLTKRCDRPRNVPDWCVIKRNITSVL
jgi:hypothetical protein